MVQSGFTLDPGQTYTSKYRFYVYDGEPTATEIERLYQDYAIPPLVEFFSENK